MPTRAEEMLERVCQLVEDAQDVQAALEVWGFTAADEGDVGGLMKAIELAGQLLRQAEERTAAIAKDVEDLGTGHRAGRPVYTHTGQEFWPFDPRAVDVHPKDLAFALARVNRWGGHTSRALSVAAHSLAVADIAEEMAISHFVCGRAIPGAGFAYVGQVRAYALLHDAHEAYVGDLWKPVKSQMWGWDRVEAGIQGVVHERFALGPIPAEYDPIIDRADRTAAYLEAKRYHPGFTKFAHHFSPDVTEYRERDELAVYRLSPYEVESLFYEELLKLEPEHHAKIPNVPVTPDAPARSTWLRETKIITGSGSGPAICRVCGSADDVGAFGLCRECGHFTQKERSHDG